MPSASWYTGINAGEIGQLPIGTLAASGVLQTGGGTIFDAWGGGVKTKQGVYVGATQYPGPALVTFGGGHTDYSGNEVYAIVDIAGTPFYARLRDKSSPDIVNADSNGGGDPVARHSYQTIQAIDDGSRNWMFSTGYLFRATDSAGSQVCHYFDFATASPNTNQPWGTKASHPDGAADISVYDAANGRLWAHSASLNEISIYTPATNTWTSALFKSPLIGSNAHSALDTVRNLWFAVWAGATTVQGYDTTDTAFATDFYAVSTTGTPPPSAAAKSIVYDPVDDRFMVWAGGSTLYYLTPPASSPGNGGNAWTWSSETLGGVAGPSAQTNGSYGRAAYLEAPNRGLLLWLDSLSAPYFFKPSTAFVGPTINTQPASAFALVGYPAVFSITATVSAGGGSISGYQWQDNSSGSFADISGATSAALTVVATNAKNGLQYRCNVTDGNGTHTSNAATLRVSGALAGKRIRSRRRTHGRGRGVSVPDVGDWFEPSISVGKWFAPELTTAIAGGGGTQSKTLTASTSVAVAAVRSIGATRVASQAGTALLSRQAAAVRSVTQAATATLATSRVILRSLAATIAQSAAVVRSVSALRSAGAASAPTVQRAVNAVRIAAAASIATAQRATTLMRSAATTGTPTLAVLKAKFMTLSASSTLAPALAKAASSTKAATLAGAATLQRVMSKTLTATEPASATASTLKARLLTLTASIGSTTTLRRAAIATRLAAAATTGVVSRAVVATKAATNAGAAALVRVPSLVRSAAQASTATATRTRVALLVLSAGTAAAATLRRATTAAKTATAGAAGALAKALPPKIFAVSQPMAASLQKLLEQAVEVLSTFFAYDVPMASLFYDVRSSSLVYDVPSIGGNGLDVSNE